MKRNIIQFDSGKTKITKETILKRETAEERQLERTLLSQSLGLGMSLALPIVGGILLGVFFDRIFSTAPRFTLSLLFVGIVISFLQLARLAKIRDNK